MSKYANFIIKGNYHGLVSKKWDIHSTWNCYKYIATVKNENTGKYIKFNYYEGIGNKANNLNPLQAFYSFLMDAISYINAPDFISFCNDFGYEYYDINAKKCYAGCESAYNRFIKLSGFNENEFYNFYNEFCEKNPDIL